MVEGYAEAFLKKASSPSENFEKLLQIKRAIYRRGGYCPTANQNDSGKFKIPKFCRQNDRSIVGTGVPDCPLQTQRLAVNMVLLLGPSRTPVPSTTCIFFAYLRTKFRLGSRADVGRAMLARISER